MAFANISPTLLDEDLATSDSSKRFLRACLNDSRKIIPSGSIFQLQHILNVSVPKEDRELPRSYHPGTDVLKVVLSDGDFNIYALMYHSSPELSMNTPPGTKIRMVKPVSITHGTFCLSSDVYEVLGGHVPKLVEKWTLQRKFNVKQEWGYNTVSSGGPPLWKPFGYNATAGIDVVALRKMKAMDIVNEQREGAKQGQGKKTEFEVQRDQALEEVKDKSLKKNWCPPAKNLMDKELVDLLREGFPLEEAEEALKKYKNPRKALQHLKDTNKVTKFREEQTSQPKEKTKWRNVKTDEEDAEPVPREYQRPTKSISLFGFIEQHIKPETAPGKPGAVICNDDQGDDYQLALSMSVDSFKREQRSKTRYEGENEFPSLQNKFVKGKSQNDYYSQNPNQEYSSNNKFSGHSPRQFNEYSRNDKQPTVKRDYPSSHKQYESSNRYDNDNKDRQTWQGPDSRRQSSDYNQRENYNRGNTYGNSESSNQQSYDQNSRYQNRNYSGYKSNEGANSRQNYYNEGYDSKNNDKYQKKKSPQGTRTFSYAGDRNSDRQNQPFLEVNEFRSQGKDDNGILNQRTYNEFKSGESGGYGDVHPSDDRQAYAGKGYNNRSMDCSGDPNNWRKEESREVVNEYREDYGRAYGDTRGSSSSGSSKKVDTLHNSFEESSYRDQSKPNNDYQSRRGGYSRPPRRDIPDRNSYQYNRQSDNSTDTRQYNSAKSEGGQYRSTFSNSSLPNSAKQDHEYSNQSHYPPSGMSSYGQGRQGQKSNDDYNGSNYSRQTMVFTRSSNGDNTQQDHQRDAYQAGQRAKNTHPGPNSSEPYKYNYHQKPYNNQY